MAASRSEAECALQNAASHFAAAQLMLAATLSDSAMGIEAAKNVARSTMEYCGKAILKLQEAARAFVALENDGKVMS